MKLFILLFTFFSLTYSAILVPENQFVLPEGIKTCEQDDPKIDECFKETFQEQMKIFKTGSKVLNIPQLDPWLLPSYRFDYSINGIQLNLIVNNGKVIGMGKTLFKNVRSNINDKELRMDIDMFFPQIFMEGNFKANVKYNDVKMKPKGYYNLTMNDISNTASIYGVYEYINGNRHLTVKNFNINPEIKGVKFNINGLFPDIVLDNVFSTFINQYWLELYKVVLTETKSTWEPILVKSINTFLSNVPIDVLITPPKNLGKL